MSAAFGEASLKAIMAAYDSAPLQKKSVLLLFASRLVPAQSLPVLYAHAFSASDDIRLRLGAVRALGFLLNKDTGQEPGTRAVHEGLRAFLKNPGREQKKIENLLSRLRTAEAYGILSAAVPLDGKQRAAFLQSGPNDITESISVNGAKELARVVLANKAAARGRIDSALSQMDAYERKTRNGLFTLLESTTPAETALAITVLGQLGKPDDANRFVPFLFHPRAQVREAAAVALGRMGDTGINLLENIFASTPAARGMVMATLPHAVSKRSAELLFRGLSDEEPRVRLQALSVFGSIPPILEKDRAALIKRAKKILRNESDPSVLLGVQLLN